MNLSLNMFQSTWRDLEEMDMVDKEETTIVTKVESSQAMDEYDRMWVCQI